MANVFVDHKDRWLSLAESDSDFAVLFIRSWIPFNVWYCNGYPHNNNRDRPTIDELKVDNNLFRTRIVALLNGKDAESVQFRGFLGQLHSTLEKFYIPDTTNRITFQNLYFRENPLKVFTPTRKKGHDYKAELLANKHVQVMIVEVSTAATKFVYNHTKYDYTHFLAHPDFIALSTEKKTLIEHCFKEIDPKRKENLIVYNTKRKIECGSVHFIDDADLLSKAIIELLYQLRCILFHGEIQPSKDNLSVYEPAYYLFRLLLKSLK